MKILLVSDTHGATNTLQTLLAKYSREVDFVCHMGDHANDLLKFQPVFPHLQMAAVAGNCENPYEYPEELFLTLAGKRILLTHGHRQGVKFGLDRLAYYAKAKGADAAFFGHRHVDVVEWAGDVLLMSPGSVEEPREGSRASYGLVEIAETITGRIVHI